MSDKQKYDKILLTSGIILGLGVAAYGALTFLGLDATYGKLTKQVSAKEVQEPEGIQQARQLQNNLTSAHEVKPIVFPTQRYVGFVAPDLWIKTDGSAPFDLVEGPPIHGDIPNKWFLDHGLEQDFIYSDVLTRDPDGDGFTVQEEYQAQTHPNDSESHPPLVDKLFVNEIKRIGIYLVFTQVDGNNYTFKGMNRAKQDIWKNVVQLHGQFGVRKNTRDKARFELVSVSQKEFKNPTLDIVETDEEAVVKDLKPNKNGQTYTLRRGTKYCIPIIDQKTSLTIAAGPKKGESFEVEEGSEFRIPGDDSQVFILKTIDNSTQTVTVANKATGEQRSLTRKK